MNKEESLNNLIDEINNIDEVKRLHELENVFVNNKEVNAVLSRMHNVEKKLVNARYYKKENAAIQYEEELKGIQEEIHNIPLLDEYIELLEGNYCMLKNITSIIDDELNNK